MKHLTNYLITAVVILLLGISLASAHGPNESDDNTNHRDNMDGSMMDGNHMQDMSDHMVIEGTIAVEDSILLTINLSPSEEMLQRMNDHMGSGHMRNNMEMSQYTNQISVSLYSLVEFEDVTGNGYSSDDTIISTYSLNSSTLNQPQVRDDSYYMITSKDNTTFKMEIDMKFDEDLFSGYKWSIELNYGFESNSSQISMLHEIETNRGPMTHQYRNQHSNMNAGNLMRHNESMMNDNDDHLPMFFGWATSAEVDGTVVPVNATSEDDVFALSIQQGDSIIYDPEIGADINAIKSVDQELDGFLNFRGFITSPTELGLILGFIAIITLSSVVIYKSKN